MATPTRRAAPSSPAASAPPEFSQLVQWLAQLPASDLARVREAARHALSPAESRDARHRRIALIGLRGAGKSTLGRALAAAEGIPSSN